eukprot:gnl/TRDRNA2_/TRDRNA2_136340_c0_seq1.p1 gnl/TRDRNA2_/TRDRNA2_136340_c0~~gnl/TRDRNA2_/TRDRNA2_136340_c0_seq1.p1  ORF type:complete len:105 (+),score=12.25 gnl/TRDRNA2_/TRDRNA2_136340_c0_seq1:2-316(+)
MNEVLQKLQEERLKESLQLFEVMREIRADRRMVREAWLRQGLQDQLPREASQTRTDGRPDGTGDLRWAVDELPGPVSIPSSVPGLVNGGTKRRSRSEDVRKLSC